jgi:hypothetical protein
MKKKPVDRNLDYSLHEFLEMNVNSTRILFSQVLRMRHDIERNAVTFLDRLITFGSKSKKDSQSPWYHLTPKTIDRITDGCIPIEEVQKKHLNTLAKESLIQLHYNKSSKYPYVQVNYKNIIEMWLLGLPAVSSEYEGQIALIKNPNDLFTIESISHFFDKQGKLK